MNEPALNLILFPSNPFPKALDTPRFKALWDKWVEHRKAYKRPGRGWETFFNDQLEWLASYGEESAYKAVETSYHNGWQGLFPVSSRYTPPQQEAPPMARKQTIPDWRLLQLLEEEAKELAEELAYDFDRRSKPAKVERQRIVKAQIYAVGERMKGNI